MCFVKAASGCCAAALPIEHWSLDDPFSDAPARLLDLGAGDLDQLVWSGVPDQDDHFVGKGSTNTVFP
jgi:hypothetical protein